MGRTCGWLGTNCFRTYCGYKKTHSWNHSGVLRPSQTTPGVALANFLVNLQSCRHSEACWQVGLTWQRCSLDLQDHVTHLHLPGICIKVEQGVAINLLSKILWDCWKHRTQAFLWKPFRDCQGVKFCSENCCKDGESPQASLCHQWDYARRDWFCSTCLKRRLWNLVWSADSLHNPKNSNSILIWR